MIFREKKDQGLELYRRTTSKICWLLREGIVSNAIREICRVTNRVDNKSVLRWFSHIGRVKSDRIAKRV